MPTIIGHTADGREVLRYDPSKGCRFRCVTCGCWLRGPFEVRGHWALHSRGHSVFADRQGRAYHQTVEGLHERDWLVERADLPCPAQ